MGSFIMTTAPSHASCLVQSFLWNIKSPKWLSPLQPRFCALWHLPSLKTKITFEREEISDHCWDSGKYDRVAYVDWENGVRSQGARFEGDRGIIVLCTVFLVSSLINVSIFHITWLDPFWTDLCIHHTLFIRPSVYGHLGCFQLLTVVNNATRAFLTFRTACWPCGHVFRLDWGLGWPVVTFA